MAGKDVTHSNGSVAPHTTAGGDVQIAGRSMRFLGWLILLALVLGLVSLLSYSLNASLLARPEAPAFAAWWEAKQFYFMEDGATFFGLLLGISIGQRLMADRKQRFRAGLLALVLAILAFAPLIHACAVAARLGWNGREASLASWIVSHQGYDSGRQIDKVLIAGVYFFKTVGFALLSGLGLIAIACAAVIALDWANYEIG